ncbi:MAG: 4Fe-4S dicluster domain-containing protein [Candidatus Helarchaeota archaeon]
MKWVIDFDKCNGCGRCEEFCPQNIYKIDDKTGKARPINKDRCVHCFICIDGCPMNTIAIEVD